MGRWQVSRQADVSGCGHTQPNWPLRLKCCCLDRVRTGVFGQMHQRKTVAESVFKWPKRIPMSVRLLNLLGSQRSLSSCQSCHRQDPKKINWGLLPNKRCKSTDQSGACGLYWHTTSSWKTTKNGFCTHTLSTCVQSEEKMNSSVDSEKRSKEDLFRETGLHSCKVFSDTKKFVVFSVLIVELQILWIFRALLLYDVIVRHKMSSRDV